MSVDNLARPGKLHVVPTWRRTPGWEPDINHLPKDGAVIDASVVSGENRRTHIVSYSPPLSSPFTVHIHYWDHPLRYSSLLFGTDTTVCTSPFYHFITVWQDGHHSVCRTLERVWLASSRLLLHFFAVATLHWRRRVVARTRRPPTFFPPSSPSSLISAYLSRGGALIVPAPSRAASCPRVLSPTTRIQDSCARMH